MSMVTCRVLFICHTIADVGIIFKRAVAGMVPTRANPGTAQTNITSKQ